MLTEEVGNILIDKLDLSTRAVRCLKNAQVLTVGELIRMTEKDLIKLYNIGHLTRNEILTIIEKIISQGGSYFESDSAERADEFTAIAEPEGKGFDFSVIDILSEKFFFKPIRMAEWFGLSRQGIYNVLDQRSPKRRRNWTGKELSEQEYGILQQLVQNKKFDYSDDQTTCCCMNNRKDDLACLFIYENEIKCFFLKDLPEELQDEIISANYHKYTEGAFQ